MSNRYFNIFGSGTVGKVFFSVLSGCKTQREIGVKTCLKQSVVSDVLARLEKAKLIEKKEASYLDKRVKHYTPNKERLVGLISYLNWTSETLLDGQPEDTPLLVGSSDMEILTSLFGKNIEEISNEEMTKKIKSFDYGEELLKHQATKISRFERLLIESYLNSMSLLDVNKYSSWTKEVKLKRATEAEFKMGEGNETAPSDDRDSIKEILFGFSNYVLANYPELIKTVTKKKHRDMLERMRSAYLYGSGLKVSNEFISTLKNFKF